MEDIYGNKISNGEESSNVDLLYTGKLEHNQTLDYDFSKYKRLIVYVMLNDLDTHVCILDFGDKTTQTGYSYPYRNITTSGATDQPIRVFNIGVFVNSDKNKLLTNFTFHDGGGGSSVVASGGKTYIYKIEGVY